MLADGDDGWVGGMVWCGVVVVRKVVGNNFEHHQLPFESDVFNE